MFYVEQNSGLSLVLLGLADSKSVYVISFLGWGLLGRKRNIFGLSSRRFTGMWMCIWSENITNPEDWVRSQIENRVLVFGVVVGIIVSFLLKLILTISWYSSAGFVSKAVKEIRRHDI